MQDVVALVITIMFIVIIKFHIYIGFISEPHTPETDSIASMKLFKKYYGKPSLLDQAKQQLRSTRPPPSWAKRNNYRWEGVCMAAFYPSKCFCGAPMLQYE